jgi:TLC domain
MSLYLGHQNIPLAAACLLTEISDIFMNIRWFMLKHKLNEGSIYNAINYIFLVTFFITRVFYIALLIIRNI